MFGYWLLLNGIITDNDFITCFIGDLSIYITHFDAFGWLVWFKFAITMTFARSIAF